MDFKSTIPSRLALWTPKELQSLPLNGKGCSLCLKPGAVECCKFQPLFYNFHLGELETSATQGRLKQRPSEGLSWSQSWQLPLGARPKMAIKPYGRFCDLFDEVQGRCSIWSMRPPECVTYFCEGDETLRKNFLTLNERWHQYEAVVAQMAMVEMGFNKKALEQQLLLFNFDENPVLKFTEADLQELWGDYWGQESEFYRRCHKFAEKLDWREIEDWL